MERMKPINPVTFVLLLVIAIGNLVGFSAGLRAVNVVGISGGGFVIGIAVCALAMAYRERRRT